VASNGSTPRPCTPCRLKPAPKPTSYARSVTAPRCARHASRSVLSFASSIPSDSWRRMRGPAAIAACASTLPRIPTTAFGYAKAWKLEAPPHTRPDRRARRFPSAPQTARLAGDESIQLALAVVRQRGALGRRFLCRGFLLAGPRRRRTIERQCPWLDHIWIGHDIDARDAPAPKGAPHRGRYVFGAFDQFTMRAKPFRCALVVHHPKLGC